LFLGIAPVKYFRRCEYLAGAHLGGFDGTGILGERGFEI